MASVRVQNEPIVYYIADYESLSPGKNKVLFLTGSYQECTLLLPLMQKADFLIVNVGCQSIKSFKDSKWHTTSYD
jgi:hypothetical protein